MPSLRSHKSSMHTITVFMMQQIYDVSYADHQKSACYGPLSCMVAANERSFVAKPEFCTSPVQKSVLSRVDSRVRANPSS